MNVKFGLLLGCLFPLCLTTQVTESERPKELGQLIMNCTPKVFCLTFGVQFFLTQPPEIVCRTARVDYLYM